MELFSFSFGAEESSFPVTKSQKQFSEFERTCHTFLICNICDRSPFVFPEAKGVKTSVLRMPGGHFGDDFRSSGKDSTFLPTSPLMLKSPFTGLGHPMSVAVRHEHLHIQEEYGREPDQPYLPDPS